MAEGHDSRNTSRELRQSRRRYPLDQSDPDAAFYTIETGEGAWRWYWQELEDSGCDMSAHAYPTRALALESAARDAEIHIKDEPAATRLARRLRQAARMTGRRPVPSDPVVPAGPIEGDAPTVSGGNER